MCKEKHESAPCSNYRCSHNLFWEGLELNMQKIHMTDKALGIRNCCRLIHEPWSYEEIARVWGLPKERIKRSGEAAWGKVHKRSLGKESIQQSS